jgi:hypothetical protein
VSDGIGGKTAQGLRLTAYGLRLTAHGRVMDNGRRGDMPPNQQIAESTNRQIDKSTNLKINE